MPQYPFRPPNPFAPAPQYGYPMYGHPAGPHLGIPMGHPFPFPMRHQPPLPNNCRPPFGYQHPIYHDHFNLRHPVPPPPAMGNGPYGPMPAQPYPPPPPPVWDHREYHHVRETKVKKLKAPTGPARAKGTMPGNEYAAEKRRKAHLVPLEHIQALEIQRLKNWKKKQRDAKIAERNERNMITVIDAEARRRFEDMKREDKKRRREEAALRTQMKNQARQELLMEEFYRQGGRPQGWIERNAVPEIGYEQLQSLQQNEEELARHMAQLHPFYEQGQIPKAIKDTASNATGRASSSKRYAHDESSSGVGPGWAFEGGGGAWPGQPRAGHARPRRQRAVAQPHYYYPPDWAATATYRPVRKAAAAGSDADTEEYFLLDEVPGAGGGRGNPFMAPPPVLREEHLRVTQSLAPGSTSSRHRQPRYTPNMLPQAASYSMEASDGWVEFSDGADSDDWGESSDGADSDVQAMVDGRNFQMVQHPAAKGRFRGNYQPPTAEDESESSFDERVSAAPERPKMRRVTSFHRVRREQPAVQPGFADAPGYLGAYPIPPEDIRYYPKPSPYPGGHRRHVAPAQYEHLGEGLQPTGILARRYKKMLVRRPNERFYYVFKGKRIRSRRRPALPVQVGRRITRYQ